MPRERGTFRGRGTTVHLRGGEFDICRKARTTATGVPFTSTTAARPWALMSRYQAPRRKLQFTSACKPPHTIIHTLAKGGSQNKWAPNHLEVAAVTQRVLKRTLLSH